MSKKSERQRRDQYYRKKYGITLEQYEDILAEANFSCALCKRHESEFSKRLALDHNHRSGRPRSVLCFYCNKRRVGQLSLEWAKKVYEYLLKYDVPEKE